MTTMPTPEQSDLQNQLGQVLQACQNLWDVPNPTAAQKAVVRLMLIALTLEDPAAADKLEAVFNTLAVLEAGDDKATALSLFLREMLAGSSEYELCKYILGDGTTMPSWPNVAAELTEIAMRDAAVQAPSQPTQPQPAPRPTPQPAPQPSPAQVFANLQGGAPATAPTPQPTPPQQTPPANPGGGQQPGTKRQFRGGGPR